MNSKRPKLQQMPVNATKDAPDVSWPAGHTTAKAAQPALSNFTTGAGMFLVERGITAEFLRSTGMGDKASRFANFAETYGGL